MARFQIAFSVKLTEGIYNGGPRHAQFTGQCP
jgi:hypothetical protein